MSEQCCRCAVWTENSVSFNAKKTNGGAVQIKIWSCIKCLSEIFPEELGRPNASIGDTFKHYDIAIEWLLERTPGLGSSVFRDGVLIMQPHPKGCGSIVDKKLPSLSVFHKNLTQPTGATMPADPVEMESLIDRIRNGRGILDLLRSGVIGEGMDILKLIPEGKYGEAVVDVGDILALEGLPAEAGAVRALGVALIPKPYRWDLIAAAECDLQKMVLLRLLTPMTVLDPSGNEPIRMMARKAAKEMTREEAQKWLGENVANIREGRKRPGLRWALRKAPEVLDALDGKPQTVGMTPERATQIINILEWSVTIATIAGMFYPPALAIATVLRLIVANLKTKFPEISAGPTFDPADGELGLQLGDFTVLA